MAGDWLSIMVHIVMSSRIVLDNLSVNHIIFQPLSERKGLFSTRNMTYQHQTFELRYLCFVFVLVWHGKKLRKN